MQYYMTGELLQVLNNVLVHYRLRGGAAMNAVKKAIKVICTGKSKKNLAKEYACCKKTQRKTISSTGVE